MENIEAILRSVEKVPDFFGQQITDINQRNAYGDSPLHIVSFWGDCDAIQALAKAGADVNSIGEHGYTPLMEAATRGRFKVVKLLIKLGAKPIRNHEGDLPSDIAGYLNRNAMRKFLRAKGF